MRNYRHALSDAQLLPEDRIRREAVARSVHWMRGLGYGPTYVAKLLSVKVEKVNRIYLEHAPRYGLTPWAPGSVLAESVDFKKLKLTAQDLLRELRAVLRKVDNDSTWNTSASEVVEAVEACIDSFAARVNAADSTRPHE